MLQMSIQERFNYLENFLPKTQNQSLNQGRVLKKVLKQKEEGKGKQKIK
jgi:hypothetical protein